MKGRPRTAASQQTRSRAESGWVSCPSHLGSMSPPGLPLQRGRGAPPRCPAAEKELLERGPCPPPLHPQPHGRLPLRPGVSQAPAPAGPPHVPLPPGSSEATLGPQPPIPSEVHTTSSGGGGAEMTDAA